MVTVSEYVIWGQHSQGHLGEIHTWLLGRQSEKSKCKLEPLLHTSVFMGILYEIQSLHCALTHRVIWVHFAFPVYQVIFSQGSLTLATT